MGFTHQLQLSGQHQPAWPPALGTGVGGGAVLCSRLALLLLPSNP